MFLFLVLFFWVWLSALSPITSVPQPERGDALGPALHLGCRDRVQLLGQSVSCQFLQSGSRLGRNGYWYSKGVIEREACF